MYRQKIFRLIRIGAIVLVTSVIVGYAVWRSLDYARGPKIEIFTPQNGESTASSTIVVSGRAIRTDSLKLNGQPVPIDESGTFKETIIVFPGINVMTLTAHDKFERNVFENVTIVGSR